MTTAIWVRLLRLLRHTRRRTFARQRTTPQLSYALCYPCCAYARAVLACRIRAGDFAAADADTDKARMDIDIFDGRCWGRRRIRRRLVGAAACIHRLHPLRH